jgi:hypothetical protein
MDCITLDFEKRYIANQSVKAIVQAAQFDSETQSIDFDCWLPIKFGTMSQYDFAWPADVPAEWYFPTDTEILEERSGSGWIGEDAEGKLPIEEIEDPFEKDEQFISGGGGAVSRHFTTTKEFDDQFNMNHPTQLDAKRKHDTGDRHPSDRGYSAQPISAGIGQSGQVVSNPYSPATTTIKGPENLPILAPMDIPLVNNGLIIDLQTTQVQDYKNDTQHVRFLSDLLHLSADGSKLCLKKTVNIWDGENPEKEFDFKYDSERSVWGAGTAWLRD